MKNAFFLIVVLTFVTGSCKNGGLNNSDQVLARVNESYLYVSDLGDLIPSGTNPSDSLSIIRNYIDNWVKNQLLLNQAEKNLNDEQKDFTRQLQDYRNSLIIYKYESELIRQNLDTIVSDQEIESYYWANRSSFELKDNVVQAIYVKIKTRSPRIGKIRDLVKSTREDTRDSLEYYAIRNAEDFQIIDNEWISFTELLRRLPVDVYNQEAYLNNNKFVQLTEGEYTYLVHILDYTLSGNISPLSQQRENIRSIILNQRKKTLIRQMQQEIWDQAVQNKVFEYY